MKKNITLDMLKNDPTITPDDIFPDENEIDKETTKDLMSMLEEPPKKKFDLADVTPPEGVSEEQAERVKAPFVDNKLYVYDELVKMLEERGDKEKIPTGFAPIDDIVDGGFEPGELIILSGPTKMGKTSFAQTTSYLQGKLGFPSLWFTLEMSWQELVKKFMEMDKACSPNSKTSDLPIFMPIDNTALSLKWMEERIIEAKKQKMVSCVYVDHLHFLLPLKDFNQNVSFLVGGIVREIKKMATKLQVPIILIAHTKKLDIKEDPDINSVRDSSFIAQESDFTFMIWRQRAIDGKKKKKEMSAPVEDDKEVYKDWSWISLEANRRNGITKKIPLGYHNGRFYPYAEYEEMTCLKDINEFERSKK